MMRTGHDAPSRATTRLARAAAALLALIGWTGPAPVALVAARTARADTIDCAPDRGCPKGSSPPACCAPPPCELYEQIRMKRALQSILVDRALRRSALKRAGGDPKKAADEFHAAFLKQAKHIKLRCPWQGEPEPPPSFETDGDCRINALIGPPLENDPEHQPTGVAMGMERAFATFHTCTEFVEAIYQHEGYHKKRCLDMSSTERANMGIHAWADEEVEGYQREIESLRADLQSYWHACSPVVDSKTRRELAREKIIALKKRGGRR
jgi:hypothetical protein